jgi:guanylate kinase
MKPIYIICGKSGSGKNFIPEFFGLRYCPGLTTREPRKSDSKDLIYSSKDIYAKFIDKTTFQTFFDGNLYWTWLEDYNNTLYDFVIASPEGIKSFLTQFNKQNKKSKHKSTEIIRPFKLIYFKTSLFKRIKNMKKRGDTWKKIFKRVSHDHKVFKYAEEFILENNGKIFIS